MRTHHCWLTIFLIVINLTSVYAQPSQRPNIIFILADDIGFDVLTGNGGQSYATPNLDSMAHHGKNFTHCESSPLCNPSRMMLLTGKQNFRNYSTWGYLSDTARTIGNLMQDAGYKTAFFGKLQLPLNTNSGRQMQSWGWNKFSVFEIMDDTLNIDHRYKSPNLIDNKGRVPDNITKDKYCDDILTQRIFNFIDNSKAEPFFVYYSMSLCHSPFSPTPDDPQFASWNPKDESDTSYFSSMVKYMDKKVGQILDKLRSAGLDTNTIVLFAGDNGTDGDINYYANGRKARGGKNLTVERGTHVPLIAYMPKSIAANSKNDDLIDFTDFLPTFAGLAHYRNLNKFGVLDGVSFYNRLFGKQDSVRSFILSHYAPYYGKNEDKLKRWVRDKEYKLYDTTEPTRNGKFYNIKIDPEEIHPLQDNELTSKEKVLKVTFRNILNTTPMWPASPLIRSAQVSSITSSSARLSATIVNAGATALMERGSNIKPDKEAYYYYNTKKDTVATAGTFSQTRTKLNPQTQYSYSLFGRNRNASHSIGYVWGTFYTISNPPLIQPTKLIPTAGECSVKLTWNNATFPTNGATKAGYLLFYSAKDIVLNSDANGKSPANVTTNTKTRVIDLQTKLPSLPATTFTINGLSPDTLYHFILVPYTYDGTNSLTYNYLTNGALTTTKRPSSCSAFFDITQQSEINSSSAVAITPNPSRYNFILKMDKSFVNKQVRICVIDVTGRVYQNTALSGGGYYTFGNELRPGVYIVYFSAGNKEYQFKIIKE